MSDKIQGHFTLEQIIRITYSGKYRTRFEYSKRDVIKKIIITKQIELHPDGIGRPDTSIIIESKSFPQYSPYIKHVKGSGKQRKYHHEYDNYLSIVTDENGKFSMKSTDWKYRLGSQKKWVDKPPQKDIKSIYRETSEKWKKDYNKEIEKIKRKYEKKTTLKDKLALKKELDKAKDKYARQKTNHIKRAKYLNVGDWNSQVKKINADFAFRCAGIYAYYGHLFGRNAEQIVGKPADIFLCKHTISLIKALCKLGILTKD